MKLSISKIKASFYSRTVNGLICYFKFYQSSITQFTSINDLGIFVDTKLNFNNRFNHIFCIVLSCWP
jgi:hypothetical protein